VFSCHAHTHGHRALHFLRMVSRRDHVEAIDSKFGADILANATFSKRRKIGAL